MLIPAAPLLTSTTDSFALLTSLLPSSCCRLLSESNTLPAFSTILILQWLRSTLPRAQVTPQTASIQQLQHLAVQHASLNLPNPILHLRPVTPLARPMRTRPLPPTLLLSIPTATWKLKLVPNLRSMYLVMPKRRSSATMKLRSTARMRSCSFAPQEQPEGLVPIRSISTWCLVWVCRA